MSSPDSKAKPRLVIATNVVAPYRVPVYEALAEELDLTLLVSGGHANRASWKKYEEGEAPYRVVIDHSITIPWTKRNKLGARDQRYFQIQLDLLKQLRKARPDFVLSIEMGVRSALCMVYAKFARKPFWIWWGGTPHSERDVGFAKKVIRKCFVLAGARFVSYGKTSTDYLLQLGVKPDRICQIQNCVSPGVFTLDGPKTDLGFDGPVLLYVGRLVRLKGIDLLLRACAAIRKEGTEFRLVLAGDGPERENLQLLAKESGLDDLVFLNEVPIEEMPALYRRADLMVLPTLDDVWGLVVNEAIFTGTPVIASKFAGCAEELLPPGQIFDPTNHEEFCTALRKGLTGGFPPTPTTVLWTPKRVAAHIAQALRSSSRR